MTTGNLWWFDPSEALLDSFAAPVISRADRQLNVPLKLVPRMGIESMPQRS